MRDCILTLSDVVLDDGYLQRQGRKSDVEYANDRQETRSRFLSASSSVFDSSGENVVVRFNYLKKFEHTQQFLIALFSEMK